MEQVIWHLRYTWCFQSKTSMCISSCTFHWKVKHLQQQITWNKPSWSGYIGDICTWSYVTVRTRNRRHRLWFPSVLEQFCKPKVGNVGMEGWVKKNIVGFHVPMDYERGAIVMQIAESMCGLNCNVVSAKTKTQTNLLVQQWKPKDRKNL